MDPEVIFDGLQDLSGSATTELAGCRRTDLDEVRGDGFAIVHGVECGHLAAIIPA